jgi:hypothetical protein
VLSWPCVTFIESVMATHKLHTIESPDGDRLYTHLQSPPKSNPRLYPPHGVAGQDFKTGVYLAGIASEALYGRILARTQPRTWSLKMSTSVIYGVLALWRRGPLDQVEGIRFEGFRTGVSICGVRAQRAIRLVYEGMDLRPGIRMGAPLVLRTIILCVCQV